jgi:glycogen synthase
MSVARVLMTADTHGGVWAYTLELAAGLAGDGTRVLIAAMGPPREVPRMAGVEVRYAAYPLEWMHDPWAGVAAAGEWLQTLAADFRPDVIHLGQAAFGALPFGVPVIGVMHSCVLSWHRALRGEEAGPAWNRYRAAVRAGLAGCSAVVAPSATFLASIQRDYGPLPVARVIWNARDGARFRPAPKRPEILAAGRVWDAAKNLAQLARVAGRLPWPVRIAGTLCHPDGGTAALRGVEHLGELPEQALADCYARAALYCLPARYEPFGLSVLEAALAGCALVLGDLPTLRELWGDAALYVPPDDDDALTAALTSLARDGTRRHALARRARERAARYAPHRQVRAYRDLYGAVVEAWRAGVGVQDAGEESACAS